MLPMQQTREGIPRADSTPPSDFHRIKDNSLEDGIGRAPGCESNSSWRRNTIGSEPLEVETLSSIAELLGLNMPRGPLVGGGGTPVGGGSAPAFGSPGSTASTQRTYSCDDSLLSGSPLDMPTSTQMKSLRSRLDSTDTFPSLSPASSSFSSTPRPILGSPGFSEYGSSLEQSFFMSSGSRSNSPESDTSQVSSLEGTQLSDLMHCLSLSQSQRLGMSNPRQTQKQPMSNTTAEQQELINLLALQGLSNAPMFKYYQQNPQLQATLLSSLLQCHQNNFGSPLSSPINSPMSSPEKAWNQSVFNNSASIHSPGTPPMLSSSPRTRQSSFLKHSPFKDFSCSPLGSPMNSPAAHQFSNPLERSITRFNRKEIQEPVTWEGKIPPKNLENATFSPKVFLGGVPWDIKESTLISEFKQFGQIRVEWPGNKPQVLHQPICAPSPKGYAYIIMESEKQVRALLAACTHNLVEGHHNWFYKISSKRMKGKVVQVIPWSTADTNWVRSPSQKLSPDKTVFVGALHGMVNAKGLATIMNDLFHNVVYAGIDTDKHRYPIGSARVTFSDALSYRKAVDAAYVKIITDKFTKKVQVNPYLEDSPCSICLVQHGPYFCKEKTCDRYFCHSCWIYQHDDVFMAHHDPLDRKSKTAPITDGNTVVGWKYPRD